MCGRLVPYLRMCGHDTAYAGDRDLEADEDLLAVATAEDRTVISRDVALANRAAESIRVESPDVTDQLAELAAAGVDLELAAEPTRCGRCNGPLTPVDRTASTPEYAPDPAAESTWRCRDCGQYFWRGSHWDRVRETLARLGRDTSREDSRR